MGSALAPSIVWCIVQRARIMAKGLSGLSVPLGDLPSDVFNWRATLLALFGAAALALIALRFEEIIPQKNPRALEFRMLAQT